MDSIENMRAFLMVAQVQSFVAAAIRLDASPSVVSKRVKQLEWQLGGLLFERTTRSVHLTDLGERQLPRVQSLVRDFDALRTGGRERPEALEGHLRLSAPAAMTTKVLGNAIASFRAMHPGVALDIVVLDRSVNPAEENLDISIVVLPAFYEGVIEEILCPYPRLLCAAPAYLENHGVPSHPRDLGSYSCIAFTPSARYWGFRGPEGPVRVAIRPTLSSSDSRVVIEMVRKGLGISVLSLPTVREALERGEIVPLMPDYPMPDLEVKAFVPESRARLARVRAMLDCLRANLSPARSRSPAPETK